MKKSLLGPALLGALALTACNTGQPSAAPSQQASGASSASGSSRASQSVTVFAAASLNKTFTQLGKDFEAQHPGSQVKLTFGGSADLLSQLSNGAPGDVLATADQATMDKAVAAKLPSGKPVIFATNNLTIVTAPGNPKQIKGLQDLARPGLSLVVCAAQVPCGNATNKVTQASGVKLAPVSQENSVTDVLGKVTSGQADAGLVYRTDAKGAGDKVATVDFPESDQVTNKYPITVLTGGAKNPASQQFVDLVLGEHGQQVLAQAGFGPKD